MIDYSNFCLTENNLTLNTYTSLQLFDSECHLIVFYLVLSKFPFQQKKFNGQNTWSFSYILLTQGPLKYSRFHRIGCPTIMGTSAQFIMRPSQVTTLGIQMPSKANTSWITIYHYKIILEHLSLIFKLSKWLYET